MKRYIRCSNNLKSNILYDALISIPDLEFVNIYDLNEIMGHPGYYYIVRVDDSQYRVIGFTGPETRLVLQEFNKDENGNYTEPVDVEYLDDIPESDWDVIVDWIENNEHPY